MFQRSLFSLGALGEVKAAVRPTGKKETLTSRCGGGEKQTIEGQEYVGTLTFHGEEGFTGAEVTHAPLVLAMTLTELVCGAVSVDGKEGGDGLRGAGLTIKRKGGPSLILTRSRPGARVYYAAGIEEREEGMVVERSVGGSLGGSAMTFAPSLVTAHFSATAPFSGRATYAGKSLPGIHRPGKGFWRGNLTVDFPGHAPVPFTGPSFKASIFPVHRDTPRTVNLS